MINAVKDFILKCDESFDLSFEALHEFASSKVLQQTKCHYLGGSPGLVGMGDDSGSRGCGFESRHRILDGYDICC